MALDSSSVARSSVLPIRRSPCAKRLSIGSLHGDLSHIAERVFESAPDGPVMVWVGHDAQVHADGPEADVSPHCIVGTYNLGVSLADLIEDLVEVRRERVRYGLLD